MNRETKIPHQDVWIYPFCYYYIGTIFKLPPRNLIHESKMEKVKAKLRP